MLEINQQEKGSITQLEKREKKQVPSVLSSKFHGKLKEKTLKKPALPSIFVADDDKGSNTLIPRPGVISEAEIQRTKLTDEGTTLYS